MDDFDQPQESVGVLDAHDSPPTEETDSRADAALLDRLSRIHEYFAEPDSATARTAALSAINADMMQTAALLGHTIREGMWHERVTVDDLDRYKSALDLLIRMNKQIAQIMQIELGISACDPNRTSPKPR